MENLTCELNGIKYLRFEIPVFRTDDFVSNAIKKHNGIIIAFKKENNYIVVSALIPEANVMAFNSEERKQQPIQKDLFEIIGEMYINAFKKIVNIITFKK